jgi:hypothetical protein
MLREMRTPSQRREGAEKGGDMETQRRRDTESTEF